MILDYLLFAIILAGLGLSGAYLRAELVSYRGTTALQRARELVQREIRAMRLRLGPDKMPQPVPSMRANVLLLVRGLARQLRIFI